MIHAGSASYSVGRAGEPAVWYFVSQSVILTLTKLLYMVPLVRLLGQVLVEGGSNCASLLRSTVVAHSPDRV